MISLPSKFVFFSEDTIVFHQNRGLYRLSISERGSRNMRGKKALGPSPPNKFTRTQKLTAQRTESVVSRFPVVT